MAVFSRFESEEGFSKKAANACVVGMVIVSIVAGVLLAVSSMREHRAAWAARFPKIAIHPEPEGFYLSSAPMRVTPVPSVRLLTPHVLEPATQAPQVGTDAPSAQPVTQAPTKKFVFITQTPAQQRKSPVMQPTPPAQKHTAVHNLKQLPPLKQLPLHPKPLAPLKQLPRHSSDNKREQDKIAPYKRPSWKKIQKQRRAYIQKHMQAVQKITHRSIRDTEDSQRRYVDKDVHKDGAFPRTIRVRRNLKYKTRRAKTSSHRPTKEQAKRAMKEVEKITGRSRKQIVEDEKDKTEKWVKQEKRGVKNLKNSQGIPATRETRDTTTTRNTETQSDKSDAKVSEAAAHEISHYDAGKLRAAYLGRLGKARARALQDRTDMMRHTFNKQSDSTEPADIEQDSTPDLIKSN